MFGDFTPDDAVDAFDHLIDWDRRRGFLEIVGRLINRIDDPEARLFAARQLIHDYGGVVI